MTKTLSLRSLDIPSIHKFGIGFDNMFDELIRMNAQQSLNYPPYNIVKNTEDSFSIEVAVSGFSEGEVAVNLDNRVLTIKGEKKEDLVALLKTNKIPSTSKTSSKASMISLILNHADQGDTLADEGE